MSGEDRLEPKTELIDGGDMWEVRVKRLLLGRGHASSFAIPFLCRKVEMTNKTNDGSSLIGSSNDHIP